MLFVLRQKSLQVSLLFRLSPPPKKKNTIGIWVSIVKEPFMESEKSNQIIKLWLFFYNSVKTPSDLAK